MVPVGASSFGGVKPSGGESCKTCGDSLATWSDLFLLPQLKTADDSVVERLIAESASDDGTVTERRCKSKLHWLASEL